jgi:glycosyltransferase involved in cell wall biosynthesis
MKILFVTKHYSYGAGDRAYMFGLEKMLKLQGHEVGYFAMNFASNLSTPFSKYFVNQIEFTDILARKNLILGLRVAARTFFSLESRSKLKRLILDFKPDLVHIQHLDTHLTYSILPLIKKLQLPIIWTLHIYTPLCINYNLIDENRGTLCKACQPNRYYQATLRKCKQGSFLASFMGTLVQYFNYALRFLKYIDVFICPSEFAKNMFINFGFPPEKLIHIPNFTDVKDVKPKFGGDNYGLFLGRLVPDKGAHQILKALKGTDIAFKIVGDGPEKADLIGLRNMLALKNVDFVGFKTGTALLKIISGANFVVVPSVCYEVSGLVILEAYAHGKPVIGARIGGISEIIRDGETGFLFDHTDPDELRKKMVRLHMNPDFAVRMGKNARSIVEKLYNPELHLKKLLEIYSALIR